MQAYIPTDENELVAAEQAAFEADIPSILGRLTGEAELLAGAAEMDSNPIADLVPMMGGDVGRRPHGPLVKPANRVPGGKRLGAGR